MSVAWVGAGIAAVGAVSQMSSAGKAADAQSEASQASSMQQAMAAAQLRQDLSPWTGTGTAANNKLSQYLGLGLGSTGTVNGLQSGLTRDQLRQQLLSQYTRSVPGANAPLSPNPPNPGDYASQAAYAAARDKWFGATTQQQNALNDPNNGRQFNAGEGGYFATGSTLPGGLANTDQIDEAGLSAAMDKYYADQAAQEAALKNQPGYGSLLTPFHNGAEFDSGPAFSFTGADLKNDPGYQFGLDQGTQGIDRGQASRGNYLSGAAMKEIARFNEDYAGTKFNEGFNRASSTYGTNLARRQNEWNTNLNAYDNNRSRVYSFLTGVSTLGQNSAAQVGAGNQQAATQIGNNMLAAGNAQAAGQVATGNALTSGINTAANSINSAGGWNNLLANGRSSYSPGGSASSGFGSGASFGNQDLGVNF